MLVHTHRARILCLQVKCNTSIVAESTAEACTALQEPDLFGSALTKSAVEPLSNLTALAVGDGHIYAGVETWRNYSMIWTCDCDFNNTQGVCCKVRLV